MDPYKILGVRRNATKATITKAFRRRALETHPDRGGEPAAFQQVQLAYDVLSDDARRERYDATGEIDKGEPDNQDVPAVGILSTYMAEVLKEMIRQGKDLQKMDVVTSMRQSITGDKGKLDKQIADLQKAAVALRGLGSRFTTSDTEKGQRLREIAAAHVKLAEDSIAALNKQRDPLVRALEMLEGVSFQHEVDAFVGAINQTWGCSVKTTA